MLNIAIATAAIRRLAEGTHRAEGLPVLIVSGIAAAVMLAAALVLRPDLPDGEGLPPSLLADLMSQVRCDAISLERFDSGPRAYGWLQGLPVTDDDPGPAEDWLQGWLATFWTYYPVLTLLRPHLRQAYLDTERRRHPVPRLTPRQNDLLHLLAAGHTNTQIARRLGISEGTVRTHLENIYEKLNVSSRTAAVIRAFPSQLAYNPAARRQASRTGPPGNRTQACQVSALSQARIHNR